MFVRQQVYNFSGLQTVSGYMVRRPLVTNEAILKNQKQSLIFSTLMEEFYPNQNRSKSKVFLISFSLLEISSLNAVHWDVVFLAYPCYTLVLTGDFLNGWKSGQHLRKTQNCHLLLVPNIGPLLQAIEFNNDSAVPPLLIYGLLFREFLKKNRF